MFEDADLDHAVTAIAEAEIEATQDRNAEEQEHRHDEGTGNHHPMPWPAAAWRPIARVWCHCDVCNMHRHRINAVLFTVQILAPTIKSS
ncbi:hypothetical protein [Sphingomonas sp. M6A6_1c]